MGFQLAFGTALGDTGASGRPGPQASAGPGRVPEVRPVPQARAAAAAGFADTPQVRRAGAAEDGSTVTEQASLPSIEALDRLDRALARLDAVVAARAEADAAPDDRDTELAILMEDRTRLAAALDAASARLAQVEAASGEVGRRLDRAIGTVETVLARPREAGA